MFAASCEVLGFSAILKLKLYTFQADKNKLNAGQNQLLAMAVTLNIEQENGTAALCDVTKATCLEVCFGTHFLKSEAILKTR